MGKCRVKVVEQSEKLSHSGGVADHGRIADLNCIGHGTLP
jgi:hypothetical protein